jgi:hypothetical protein
MRTASSEEWTRRDFFLPRSTNQGTGRSVGRRHGALPTHYPRPCFWPAGSRLVDGCIDSGSDDTIFPMSLARKLGIDLMGASQGEAHPVGGTVVPYAYASVTLRASDGIDTCHWQAMVGFVYLPLRWALLGHAGFLDHFDTALRGARREVFIIPNAQFPGVQRAMSQTPSP